MGYNIHKQDFLAGTVTDNSTGTVTTTTSTGICDNTLTGSSGGTWTVPTTGTTWTIPHAASPLYIPYIDNTGTAESIVDVETPKCALCRKEVDSVKSFVSKGKLTYIVKCHDEKRRIDVCLRKFNDNEQDALDYIHEENEYFFDDETEWKELKPRNKVKHENADKLAMERWLSY